MKIIFVRHGQTSLNINNESTVKKMQGQSDLELNDIGKNQAIDVKNKLKEKNIDIILVSPLKRAQQTAIIINESLNKKIITDKRLIEMNYGSIEGKDFRKDYWDLSFDYKKYGGETIDEFKNRIFSFINSLKEDYPNQTVLLVSHNGVARMIQCYFEGIPSNNNLAEYGVGNCELMEYEL